MTEHPGPRPCFYARDRGVDVKTSARIGMRWMRTTLTIDDDVAAVIERLRRTREASLRDI